jgi:hypothetical protein
LSLLLHVVLVSLGLSRFARLEGGRAALPTPEVLTFRFREATAEVEPQSHVETAPATPLLGRHASRARDRILDERDTPVPAGRIGTDNALPGDGGAGAASAAPSGPPPDPSDSPGGAEAQGVRPGVVDALGSPIAMLTGRPDEARRGRGAQHSAEFGAGGALEFGDYAFSTKAWDYEPYWHYMRERLYANWHPPAAYKDYGIIQGGWTLVRAVLDRRGRVTRAEILGTDGHASLHPASFAAMMGASPFRPLPAEFPEDSLVVTVRFIYMQPGERP